MELTPRDLALIIWFNTHNYAESWTEQIAMEWLEEFIGVHLEEAEKRGRDSFTPSHDAKETKDDQLEVSQIQPGAPLDVVVD